MPQRFPPRQPVSWTARRHIRKADLRRDLEEYAYVLDAGRDPLANVAELQALDTFGYVDGASALVVDGLGTFQWDALSVAAHDGVFVVQPTGIIGAGRWVRPQTTSVSSASTSTPGSRLFALADHSHQFNASLLNLLTYPNVAALKAVNTTGFLEGVPPVIVTALGTFQWDPISVVANDDVYIIQPTIVVGAGRWVRPQPPALTGTVTPGSRLFALADHTHAVDTLVSSVAVNASPYNVGSLITVEFFVLVDTTAVGWIAGGDVVLPAVPRVHSLLTIKDVGGNALVKSITIQGNGVLIDGQPFVVLNSSYGAYRLLNHVGGWSIV